MPQVTTHTFVDRPNPLTGGFSQQCTCCGGCIHMYVNQTGPAQTVYEPEDLDPNVCSPENDD